MARIRRSQGRGDEVGRGKVLGADATSGGAGEKTLRGHEETEWRKTRAASDKRQWKRREHSGKDAILHREVMAREPISQRAPLRATRIVASGVFAEWGLRRAPICHRCGGYAAIAPGGFRAICGKRTCRAWAPRGVLEVGIPRLPDIAIAGLIWRWAYGLTTDQAACAVGPSYSAATHAFQRSSSAAALAAWEAQEGLVLGGTAEMGETFARTHRLGVSGAATSPDGMSATFVGAGRIYVRFCGALPRGTRDFVLYGIPDALTAVLHDGKPCGWRSCAPCGWRRT